MPAVDQCHARWLLAVLRGWVVSLVTSGGGCTSRLLFLWEVIPC